MALIDIQALTVKYPGRKQPILEDVSLSLRAGETVLLLGASGCGKSTLALTLNGLIPHESGSILQGSVHVHDLETQRESVARLAQEVGIVFQDPEAQFATLTVEDEIAFGLENLCVPVSEMDRRIEQALLSVGLPGHRQRPVDQLSGGEKQRIALASLLAMEPGILVFDEPTANLDPVGTQNVFALLRQIKEQSAHTIILIEHKLDDLMDLVDRVVVLGRAGSIIADGTPRSVFYDSIEVLQEYGVWVPQIALLAQRLRAQGVTLPHNPVTLPEAEQALRQSDIVITPILQNPPTGEDQVAQPAIEIRDLSLHHGARTILDHISLSVPQGDFLALVGANGAGKTTLAHHMMDIQHAPAGKVLLHGKEITRFSARELVHEVGYVFQNPEHQFITESVSDEISYSLRVMGLPSDEVEARTSDLLARFGLTRLARANPFTLSHGEKRRLSVATVLAAGQRTLILDEPTFGQDQRNAEALLDLLRSLHEEGHTIVVITHDMTLVAQHARHVAVMSGGQLLFHGTPLDLFAQPDLLTRANLTPPPLALLSARMGWPNLPTLNAIVSACTIPTIHNDPI